MKIPEDSETTVLPAEEAFSGAKDVPEKEESGGIYFDQPDSQPETDPTYEAYMRNREKKVTGFTIHHPPEEDNESPSRRGRKNSSPLWLRRTLQTLTKDLKQMQPRPSTGRAGGRIAPRPTARCSSVLTRRSRGRSLPDFRGRQRGRKLPLTPTKLTSTPTLPKGTVSCGIYRG